MSFQFSIAFVLTWHARAGVKLCMLFRCVVCPCETRLGFLSICFVFLMRWAVAWTRVRLTAPLSHSDSGTARVCQAFWPLLCLKESNRGWTCFQFVSLMDLFYSSRVRTDCPNTRLVKCLPVLNSNFIGNLIRTNSSGDFVACRNFHSIRYHQLIC